MMLHRLEPTMRKTPVDPVSPLKSVGQELRDARERRGKQLEDVSRALKIRPNCLDAIEEGRFEDLPGRAFTIGFVARYARYLQLDVGNLQQRLDAEMGAHHRFLNHRTDFELPFERKSERRPGRKFPVPGIVAAGLLLAALAYSSDDILAFAMRALEQATEDGVAQTVVDAPAPAAIELQPQVLIPDPLVSLPFEVAVTEPASARPELLPPIPVLAVTQAVALRPELLPPIPMIAVTQEVALRPELLPPIPMIAVTQAVALRPELLPPIPVLAVTQEVALRPELLPPIPVLAVTQEVALRPELLPAAPQIAGTPAVSVAPRADDFPLEDKVIIRDYVLTTRKFNAFIAGITALAIAKNTDDTLARELDAIDGEPARTLADLRAQVTGHPRAFEFYQRQGLTADDAVLIPLVAGYASAAIPRNNPILFADRLSPAQLDFIRANSRLMGRLVEAYAALFAARS
jgi:Helix-turn-helix domain